MDGGVDLHSIVQRIGGDIYDGGNRAVVPGPGHSKRDRSLSLRLVSEIGVDRVLWSNFGRGSLSHREVMEHLGVEQLGVREDNRPSREERARWHREREAREREIARQSLEFCEAIWRGTVPLEGSPAETYLYSRGLILEAYAVRWHPLCPRSKRPLDDPNPPPPPHGAMVALVTDPKGDPIGLHCTFITPDGRKAFGDRSRIMFGQLRTGAVRLGQPTDGVLAVGEGIESTGSYGTIKGVMAWPLLTTSLMKTFQVPPGVRRLLIAADNDEGGLQAAHDLALRARKVCDVEIDLPPEGKDWNNVLMETAA